MRDHDIWFAKELVRQGSRSERRKFPIRLSVKGPIKITRRNTRFDPADRSSLISPSSTQGAKSA